MNGRSSRNIQAEQRNAGSLEYWLHGRLALFLGGVAVVLASCANPVAPSGGPRDKIPPSIVQTRPVRDTVDVPTDTRSVFVQFSEYIERSSLPQALSVRPRFDEQIRFDWSGQGVSIELPTSLRDSTTYLFSFGTTLSDAHGVSLDDPITVAFSTGPRINRGQIEGRVAEPTQGAPRPNVDVYAYALPDSATVPPRPLPDRPTYRTQTGDDGTFSFDYMREQRYYVVALMDNNRNRKPDRAEPYAVPPRPALAADSGAAEVPVPWMLTSVDTLAPTFQRVQPLSRQRLRLSFNEPIQIAAHRPSAWTLRDSVADRSVPVRALYRSPDRADALVLRTAPMDPARHTLLLTSALVTDTLGQGLVPDTARFRAVSRADTVQTRFRSFVPKAGASDSTGAHPLLPTARPGVRFNQAPDSTTLRRMVSAQDTTGRSRTYALSTDDGRTYSLGTDPPLRPGEFVDVAVDVRPVGGPDTTFRRRYRRVTSRALGALEGRGLLVDTTRSTSDGRLPTRQRHPMSARTNEESDARNGRTADTGAGMRRDSLFRDSPIVVELIPTESAIPLEQRSLSIPPGSTFVFRQLPEGTFRFRAYVDRNRNGRWDGGRIRTYQPAEPVIWSGETVDSRPRWTNVLPGALRIPILAPAPETGTVPTPDTTTSDTSGR